jgi:hypothetical protein
LRSSSYQPAGTGNRPGAYNSGANASGADEPSARPAKTKHCQDNFDTQQDGNIVEYPTEVFVEQVDAPGVKELYREGAKQGGEHNNAIGAWSQKAIQAASRYKRFCLGAGL